MAAVTNHLLDGFKHTHVFSFGSGGQKSDMDLIELKSR